WSMQRNESRRAMLPNAYNVILLTAIALTGCAVATKQTLTPAQSNSITAAVRTFASQVAEDVTRRGPAAWRDQFADGPEFFMPSEGGVVFSRKNEANRGIEKLTSTIAHIELRWEEPMRVDPLTATLAMVAMPYQEVRIDTAGRKVEESGYFTGLAEL